MKKKGKTVIIIILILIVLGLAGFIVYDKVIKKDVKEEVSNEVKVEVGEETEVDKYELFIDNLKKLAQKYEIKDSEGNYYYQMEQVNIDEGADSNASVAVTKDSKLLVSVYGLSNDASELSSKYNNYVLDENVLVFYVSGSASARPSTLYYIKEDGTVSSALLTVYAFKEGLKVTNNVGNLKNIVSIIPVYYSNGTSGTNSTVFIDIDGNTYVLDSRS